MEVICIHPQYLHWWTQIVWTRAINLDRKYFSRNLIYRRVQYHPVLDLWRKKNQEKSETDKVARNEQYHHWPSEIMDFVLWWGFFYLMKQTAKADRHRPWERQNSLPWEFFLLYIFKENTHRWTVHLLFPSENFMVLISPCSEFLNKVKKIMSWRFKLYSWFSKSPYRIFICCWPWEQAIRNLR